MRGIRTRRLVVCSMLTISIALTSGCSLLSNSGARQSIDLEELAENRWSDWAPLADAEIVSEEFCADLAHCEQAIRSSSVMIIKFDSTQAATDYFASGGIDGEQIDPIVVSFASPNIPAETRRDVINTLSNINASDGG